MAQIKFYQTPKVLKQSSPELHVVSIFVLIHAINPYEVNMADHDDMITSLG